MNIGQFSDSFLPIVDGVGRVAVSYATALAGLQHSVIAVTPQAHITDAEQLPFAMATFSSFPLPIVKLPYRAGFPALDRKLGQVLRQADLDIIHVHAPFLLGRYGVHFAKKQNIPVVATFHSKFYDDFLQITKSEKLAWAAVRNIVRFFERCDEVWAVSESSANTLREYGYEREIIVMPNGTDIRTLDKTVFPELIRRYQIDVQSPLLLYVGQLNWKKNIRRILEAVCLLQKQGTTLQLLLAGMGPHKSDIENTIEQWGLQACTRFTGHMQSTRELDGLYALADLLVFPSLYDNGPMVVREAAAMQTPSLLIAGSSAAENIRDGFNGFTCRDDAQALADVITRVFKTPELGKEVGKNAYETIPVSWETLMTQVLQRYSALIAKKKA